MQAIDWVLSALFPMRDLPAFSYEDMKTMLEFRERDSRHAHGLVWSSVGNVKQHQSPEPLTIKEYRNREI